jgi:SpoVK/Ycf46/Vps4 family AAA+-type ATPase
LIEINAHSLFSKWFSESGKLVMRMFQHLTQIISDERAFVCLLIDEVESLAAARQCSSSEPSDSIRVVNAFLTQLDRLKSAKNLLVLTTSNICGSIDLAFIDRADIKQFIGLPGSRAIYSILSSSLNELLRAGVISTRRRVEFGGWMDASAVEMLSSLLEQSEPSSSPPLGAAKLAESPNDFSVQLWKISQLAGGLSGRMLRKLPFLAFASSNQFDSSLDLWDYLHLLRTAVERENADRTKLQS